MKGEDVLKLARKNGIVCGGNLPSANGIAVLGPISDTEINNIRLNVAAQITAEISRRFPPKITKADDHKSVNVECTVFAFSKNQLVRFVSDCFVAARIEVIDQNRTDG